MSTLAQLIRQACEGDSSGWEELFNELDDLIKEIYRRRFPRFRREVKRSLNPGVGTDIPPDANVCDLFQVSEDAFYNLALDKIYSDNFILLLKCLDSVSIETDEQIEKWLNKTLQRVLEEEIRRYSPVSPIWKKVQRIFTERPEFWQKEKVGGDTFWLLVDYNVTPVQVDLRDLLEAAKDIPLPPVKWVWNYAEGIKRPQIYDSDFHDFFYTLVAAVGGRVKKNMLIDLLAKVFCSSVIKQKSTVSEKMKNYDDVHDLISNLPDDSQSLPDEVLDFKVMAVKCVSLMDNREKVLFYHHYGLDENKQDVARFLKVSRSTITKDYKKLFSKLTTQLRDEGEFTIDESQPVIKQVVELLREEFSE